MLLAAAILPPGSANTLADAPMPYVTLQEQNGTVNLSAEDRAG
jgi:hypothetical protein